MIFTADTTTKASFEKLYDADGKVWIEAVAHGTLAANTPYWVVYDEYGPKSVALSDLAITAYVGVPAKAYSSGEVAKFQIGGPVDDMVTPSLSVSVGHSLTINTGAVADGGADYTGAAGEFAVCRTVSTSSTTQDVQLIPERVLSVT